MFWKIVATNKNQSGPTHDIPLHISPSLAITPTGSSLSSRPTTLSVVRPDVVAVKLADVNHIRAVVSGSVCSLMLYYIRMTLSVLRCELRS